MYCYCPGPSYLPPLTVCCQQSSCGGFVRVIALLSAGISRVLSSGWLTVTWSLVLEQVDDLFTWHPICSLFLIMTCSLDNWQCYHIVKLFKVLFKVLQVRYKSDFYAFWNPASNAIIHKNILGKLNIYQEENGKNASGMAATRGRSKIKVILVYFCKDSCK